jgi:hypothetical protein
MTGLARTLPTSSPALRLNRTKSIRNTRWSCIVSIDRGEPTALFDPIVLVFETAQVSRSNGVVRENHRHLTNLDEANLSPCAVNGGFKLLGREPPPRNLHQSVA